MANDPIQHFIEGYRQRVFSNAGSELQKTADTFMRASMQPKYSYNFTWLGRPVIQYPQDIIAMQEIIWEVKPDLIIETGIAHGDRKSTRLNSSHIPLSRMPSSA